jgi:hypothetical protein
MFCWSETPIKQMKKVLFPTFFFTRISSDPCSFSICKLFASFYAFNSLQIVKFIFCKLLNFVTFVETYFLSIKWNIVHFLNIYNKQNLTYINTTLTNSTFLLYVFTTFKNSNEFVIQLIL